MVEIGFIIFALLAVFRWPLALVYVYLKFVTWYLRLPFKIVKKLIEVIEQSFAWIYFQALKIIY